MTNTPLEAPEGAVANTDREVWRGPDLGIGDFYADSVFITKDNAIGINCGGTVVVRRAREWLALVWPVETVRRAAPPSAVIEALREREECAKIADNERLTGEPPTWITPEITAYCEAAVTTTAREIARKIRAREALASLDKEAERKPCPEYLITPEGAGWSCDGQTTLYETKERALAAWKSRTPPPQDQGEADPLERELLHFIDYLKSDLKNLTPNANLIKRVMVERKEAATTIAALRAEVNSDIAEILALRNDLDNAIAERDAARTTLKPFAEFAEGRHSLLNEGSDDSVFYGGSSGPYLTRGDFRRARAASEGRE